MLKSIAIMDQTTLSKSKVKPKRTLVISDSDESSTTITHVHFVKGFSEDSIDKYPNRKVAILNFANAHSPGINFPNNGRTQEEQLLRKFPELFYSLDYNRSKLYPLLLPSVAVTDWCTQWRDKDLNLIPIENRKHAVFITAAAPDHYQQMFDLTKIKQAIKTILTIPNIYPKPDLLVLGAWGCGAFLPSDKQFTKIQQGLPKKYQKCLIYEQLIATLFIEMINTKCCNWKDIVFIIPEKNKLNIFQDCYNKSSC